LAEALGVSNAPKWEGSVDRVWSFTFSNGTASLANGAQMLLYGDSARQPGLPSRSLDRARLLR